MRNNEKQRHVESWQNISPKCMSLNSQEFSHSKSSLKILSFRFLSAIMCNTNENKGKEKVNEESISNLKMMKNQNNVNKRKAIVMEESHFETKNSKSPQKDIVEEESIDSPKEIPPFLLFGFIVDQRKGIQNAYSCKFCSRKFTTPRALGGHQSSHKFERSLVKKRIQAFNEAWINYSNGNQGISLNTATPFHMGCGYQCFEFNNMIQHAGSSNFYAGNLFGALPHIPHIDEVNKADQGIVSHKINMTEIEFGSISEGGVVSDKVDQEDNETQEEEAPKIDLTLKL
jgi:hypothetical protein